MIRHWTWVAGLVVCLALACSRPVSTPVEAPPTPVEFPAGWFEDVTNATGIQHIYRNDQEAGHLSILETLGGGVAVLDFDQDGKLDLFFTGGGEFTGPDKNQISGLSHHLYRNLGDWSFSDVTQVSGLAKSPFYSHGAYACDYDLDGYPDLVVTGWGGLALYHNETNGLGGRRFTDVTQRAGMTREIWCTSAAWADFDGDGYPDLYVCRYVDWSFSKNPKCSYHDANLPDVCPPTVFDALPHALYRNNRDGTFTEIAEVAGLHAGSARSQGKGLGVVVADFNNDSLPDIYVANDTTDNLLFLNRGKAKFVENGVVAGVARDDRGVPNGSMGVAVGDPDGTGRPSLLVTNYQNELPALYRNDGQATFTFHSQASGIAAVGRSSVGFGCAFADFDRDGWEDLLLVNGHVIRHPVGTTVAQKPILLRNEGKGRFAVVSDLGGEFFRQSHHARGLVTGDFDNDGRLDLVVARVNQPAIVLRNVRSDCGHWVGIELEAFNHQDLVGAKVTLEAGGRKQTRFPIGGGSYLSSSDRRFIIGIGENKAIGTLTVEWPRGGEQKQTWEGLAIDRYHRLRQAGPSPP